MLLVTGILGSRGHATFIISHNGKTSLALFLGNVTFAKHLTLREISHMFHFLRSAIFISIHFMLRVVSFSKKIYTSTRILSMDIILLHLPGAVRQRLLPEPVTKADATRPMDVDIVDSLMSDYMENRHGVCFFSLEMLVQHKREEREIVFARIDKWDFSKFIG